MVFNCRQASLELSYNHLKIKLILLRKGSLFDMKYNKTNKIALSGLFIALGLILPFITGQIPSIGRMLLPMHIPVLIAGFVLGWQYGLVIGFIVPLLRSLLFTTPPLYPIAIAMAFELATYGLVTGFLYKKLSKNISSIYISLIGSMLIGRFVWGIASYILYNIDGGAFTFEMFIAGGFLNATIGIALQIIIIPPIIMALQKNNLLFSTND